jgi:glycine/D-amino acid oxidase-like deaminating enzyme
MSFSEVPDRCVAVTGAMQVLAELEVRGGSGVVDAALGRPGEHGLGVEHPRRVSTVGGPVVQPVEEVGAFDPDPSRGGGHGHHAVGDLVGQLRGATPLDDPGRGELCRPDDAEVLVDPDTHGDVDDAEELVDDVGPIDHGDVGQLAHGVAGGDEVGGGACDAFDVEADGDDVDAGRCQLTMQCLPHGEVGAASSPRCPCDDDGAAAALFGKAPDAIAEHGRQLEIRRLHARQGPSGVRGGSDGVEPGAAIGHDRHAQAGGHALEVGGPAQGHADLAPARALGLDGPSGARGKRVRIELEVVDDHVGDVTRLGCRGVERHAPVGAEEFAHYRRGMSRLRATNMDKLDGGSFDVLIVGGGINGAVAAAALTARGAKVAVIDRGDFAGETSQESSNLVWGGFKYLENYEIPLVRKLCKSRNRLMRTYPANISEIGFLAAMGKTSPFPPWLAAVGSFAYWGIGSFKTNAPRPLSAESIERLEPVIDTSDVRGGIEYADAILEDNDARFVFGFVRTAMDLGAVAANYVELTGAERHGGRWHAELRDGESGRELRCDATVLVNAAGPYLDGINESFGLRTEHRIVYSKGIHLVVDQLTPNRRVLAFFDDTRRLFYVIPMGRRSVIGTTDTRVDDPLRGAHPIQREAIPAARSRGLGLRTGPARAGRDTARARPPPSRCRCSTGSGRAGGPPTR